jgi:hypothetical protein
MPDEYRFTGGVEELLYAAERDNLVELPADLGLAHAEDGTVQIYVLSTTELGVEPGADFEQAGQSAAQMDLAFGRVSGPGKNLEQRGLARSVVPDDANHFAGFHIQIEIAQCPEVASPLTAGLSGPTTESSGPFPERLAEGATDRTLAA